MDYKTLTHFWYDKKVKSENVHNLSLWFIFCRAGIQFQKELKG